MKEIIINKNHQYLCTSERIYHFFFFNILQEPMAHFLRKRQRTEIKLLMLM